MTGTWRWRRGRQVLAVALTVAALAPFTSSGFGAVEAATPSRFVTGWVPYWEMDDGDGAIGINSSSALFADAATFSFTTRGPTTVDLVGGETPFRATLAAGRAQKLPVFATVTDGMGRLGMATLLASADTRTALVTTIVGLANSRQLDGIDIDYENFAFSDSKSTWPTTRVVWNLFIDELSAALHANGKLLSAAVPAIWDGGRSGYTVYDWANIIGDLDRMRIMVYDWSFSSAGPNAPMSWVQNVLAYVTATIPADQRHKVQLGVPTYGYNYATIQTGTCPTGTPLSKVSVQTEAAATIATDNGVVPQRDVSGEMTFTYTKTYTGLSNVSLTPPVYVPPAVRADIIDSADGTMLKPATRVLSPGAPVSCTVKRTVFYPDTQSVVDRANAAIASGLSGIAIWALGYENPDLWGALAGIDGGRPTGVELAGTFDAATVEGAGVRVTGWAVDPEFDLPVPLTITVNGTVVGRGIANSVRSDLAAGYPGIDPLHGFSLLVAVAPGSQICISAAGWGSGAATAAIGCRTT